jgi:hypothetical protein
MSVYYWAHLDETGEPAHLYRVVEETYEEQIWNGIEWIQIVSARTKALNADETFRRLEASEALKHFPSAFHKH